MAYGLLHQLRWGLRLPPTEALPCELHHHHEGSAKDYNEDALGVEKYLRAFGREDCIGDNTNRCEHAYERCKIHKSTPKSAEEPDRWAPECGGVGCASG